MQVAHKLRSKDKLAHSHRGMRLLAVVTVVSLLSIALMVLPKGRSVADTRGNDPVKLSNEAAKDGGKILPGNTPARTVKFFDGSGAHIEADNQTVIAGDRIFEPKYPGKIEGKIFDHWALKTTDRNWEAKVFDFNRKVVANSAGIPVVDSQVGAENITDLARSGDIEIYAQYRKQHTIRFLIPNAKGDKSASKDRVVYSFVEKKNCQGDTDSLNSALCSFGTYRKAVRIFLEERKYVKGWTRSRKQALNFDPAKSEDKKDDPKAGLIPDSEKLNSNEDFYAIIVEGVEVNFNSRGGSVVNSVFVDAGQTVGKKVPANPTRPGYNFVGWTANQKAAAVQNTGKVEGLFDFDNTPINEDTKLYAVWTPAETTINVQYMVEDVVDKNGQPLPLYYDVYDQSGEDPSSRQFVSSSIPGGAEGDAAREATKRQGVFRLQKVEELAQDRKTNKKYLTGKQVNLNNICDMKYLNSAFDSNYFEFEQPSTQPKAGLAADGSTVFNCKIKRKRGTYLTAWDNNKKQLLLPDDSHTHCYSEKDTMHYSENGKDNSYKCRFTIMKFYGLLGGNVVQKGTAPSTGTVLPGENLKHVYKKAVDEYAKRLEINQQDYGFWKYVAEKNRKEVTGTVEPGDNDEAYANPPSFYPNLPETTIVVVAPEKNLVYIRAELDPQYLVSKSTSDYDGKRGRRMTPSDSSKRLDDLRGKNSHQMVDPQLEGKLLEEDAFSVRPGDASTYTTEADFDSRPGFKRILYRRPDYQGCCSFKAGKDSKGNWKGIKIPFKPDWVPPEVKDSYHAVKGREDAEILVMPYKRLSYNLTFLAGDSSEYTSPVPYNWSVTKAAETTYAYSDNPEQLTKAQGLKDFLKKYVPGKTLRKDGAVFEGWCTDLSCEIGSDNPPLDLSEYKMPYFDTYLVAKWKPVKVKLRVFYDANKLDKHDAYDYNLNDEIDPENYAHPHVPEGLDLTANDFRNWVYRERYPVKDENGKELKDKDGNTIYRDGDWRIFDSEVRMSHDIDLVPLWKFEAYQIKYLPGLTATDGTPTGPQGSGETNQGRLYFPLLTYARLKDSGFTPPPGYVFGGWYDETEKKQYYPDDDVQVSHNNLKIKARWLPKPPKSSLIYHTNYPQGVTEAAKTKEIGLVNGKATLVNNTVKDVEGLPEGWQINGWKFVGWSESKVPGSEPTPAGETNANVRYTQSKTGLKDSNLNQVLLNHRHHNDLYAVWERIPEVDFYVHKVSDETDSTGNKKNLSGAKFAVYRNEDGAPGQVVTAELATAADLHCQAKGSATNTEGTSDVTTPDSDPASGVTSGSCFTAKLPPGEYFLVETQAPKGYELLSIPVQFTLTASDVELAEDALLPAASASGKIITITNTQKVALPLSGSLGVYVWIFIGLGISTGGIYLNHYYAKRKDA